VTRTAEQLLHAWTDAQSIAQAERLLAEMEPLAAELARADCLLGDLYDELASEAADGEDFATAARLQAHSIGLASSDEPSYRRTLLGYYQVAAGDQETGRATFAQLLADEPDDVDCRLLFAMALEDLDEHEALAVYDDAVSVARRIGDPEQLGNAQVERAELRLRLGMEPDADDLAADDVLSAREAQRGRPTDPAVLLWLPPSEHDAALARWPRLVEQAVGDPDRYTALLEQALRDHAEADGVRPQLLPVTVAELIERQLEPTDADATPEEDERLADWIDEATNLISWPPGRNDPCWCGSGRKYKRCCGAA